MTLGTWIELLAVLLLAAASEPAFGETNAIPGVNVYQAVPGLAASDQYAVRVCAAGNTNVWAPVFAWETVCKPDSTNDAYYPILANWTHTYVNFETTVPVTVEISRVNGNAITNAAVHPDYKARACGVANGKVYVTLNQPCNVAVDINGQMDNQDTGYNPTTRTDYNGPPINTISIHANPVLAGKPATNDPTYFYVLPGTNTPPTNRNLYFLPGVHDIGLSFPLQANQSYYIPGDAIVYGTFNNALNWSGGDNHIHIFGHGTISGAHLQSPDFVTPAVPGTNMYIYHPIDIAGARNCTAEGVTIADPSFHSIFMDDTYNPGTPTITSWVKIFGWRANGDGFNQFGNGQIRNCFIRVQDDSTVVTGAGVSDTVIWNDANGASFRGMGTQPSANTPLLFNDCDIIYNRSEGINNWGSRVFTLFGAGGACGAGVIFSNINVSDPRPTQQPFFICMTNPPGPYNWGATAVVPGDMAGTKYINVTVKTNNRVAAPNFIWGASGAEIHDITFDNLSIAGNRILSDPFTTNGYVYNLFFTNSDTNPPVISGAPASGTYANPFTFSLSVDKSYGYYSTNGGAYVSFTSAGVDIPINATTTLSLYGRDVLGNNSATNTYVYTVNSTPLPPTITSVRISGGLLNFSVTNSSGSYVVQTSTNLANDQGWTSDYTNTAPFTFTDPGTVNSNQQRFYRAVRQ